jgi:hypothetical protein
MQGTDDYLMVQVTIESPVLNSQFEKYKTKINKCNGMQRVSAIVKKVRSKLNMPMERLRVQENTQYLWAGKE